MRTQPGMRAGMQPGAEEHAASLRSFLIVSALLHLLVAMLLPAEGMLRSVDLETRRDSNPGSTSKARARGGAGAEDGAEIAPFLPLGALRLQVLDLEIEREATRHGAASARALADLEADEETEPHLPVPESVPPLPEFESESGGSGAAESTGVESTGVGSGGVGEGAGLVQSGGESGPLVPPVIVAMSWPEYPPEARKRPSVPIVLAVHVTETGEVDGVRVENASGCPACERAAVKSAWRLRFLPGTRGGNPIAMWMRFPVTFGRR